MASLFVSVAVYGAVLFSNPIVSPISVVVTTKII
jgi:hypothetical protein